MTSKVPARTWAPGSSQVEPGGDRRAPAPACSRQRIMNGLGTSVAVLIQMLLVWR
jgi:hypothetical protein